MRGWEIQLVIFADMQKIAFLSAFFLVTGLSAQNLEHYLLYDALCMQKYDYERNEEYKELAFWDYHLKLNDKKTLIFRVLKQDSYIDEVAALDKEPLRCSDEKLADTNFISELNSSKISISIVEYRKSIRALVMAGKMEETFSFCQRTFPNALTGDYDACKEIVFELQCQHFIELVKSATTIEALKYAQQGIINISQEY
jgi:hypothetical protein